MIYCIRDALYKGKDKNATQTFLPESVGSPAVLFYNSVSNPPSLGRPFFAHNNFLKEGLSWAR